MILSIFIFQFFVAMSESKVTGGEWRKKSCFLDFILSQHIA